MFSCTGIRAKQNVTSIFYSVLYSPCADAIIAQGHRELDSKYLFPWDNMLFYPELREGKRTLTFVLGVCVCVHVWVRTKNEQDF